MAGTFIAAFSLQFSSPSTFTQVQWHNTAIILALALALALALPAGPLYRRSVILLLEENELG
jgi:hypothetical protein